MTQVEEVIAKLEKASEPDVRLDHAIAHLTGNAHQSYNEAGEPDDIVFTPDYPRGGGKRCNPLRYTSSLDAAMTLARNQGEALVMLYRASRALDYMYPRDPVNLWPAIRAALVEGFRARIRQP